LITLPNIATSKIAIKLKPATETLVKKGHPWVFENSIIKQNKEGQSGDNLFITIVIFAATFLFVPIYTLYFGL
jgi:hypothetical protein